VFAQHALATAVRASRAFPGALCVRPPAHIPPWYSNTSSNSDISRAQFLSASLLDSAITLPIPEVNIQYVIVSVLTCINRFSRAPSSASLHCNKL